MRVHQVVPRLDAGDAIGNIAMSIHQALVRLGCEARIFAYDMDEYGRRFASFDVAYREFMSEERDLLLYHYGLYCDNYRLFQESRNRKALIYHNITPPGFYEAFLPEAVRLCTLGREVLAQLTECDLALGVSDFNRRELVAMGFPEERTGVLPMHPPVEKLEAADEDPRLARWLADGKVNLLHVGRAVPNKRCEDVIRLFACYHRGVNARSRLVFAGPLPINTYYSALLSLARRMGVADRVFFLGKVSDGALKACYRRSHYYVSMSEHEGFCVPLLEAFHFGLPVLAYAAGAVPETMGKAGVLFHDKDYPLLAELLDRLGRDAFLRERILEAQRARLDEFGEEHFTEGIRKILVKLASGARREQEAAQAMVEEIAEEVEKG
ncbi:MAG: glycosyltransferase family 4 protein [Actinobacteria bacterium]|nr:glycosyltransferase family 4 protein [Actinomycetota bacterium]